MKLLIASALITGLAAPAAAQSPLKKCGFHAPTSLAELQLKQGSPRPAADTFLDSAIVPARVHYQNVDAARAPALLAAVERAWDFEITQWGWDLPEGDGSLGGGFDRVDFYLEQNEFAGYADVDDYYLTADRVVCVGFLVVNPQLDDGSIESTTAHEFNHLLQMAIDCFEDQQLFESSATFVESWVAPADVATWSFAAWYQDGWQQALDFYDYAQPPQYGSFIFLQYLAERFDDGTPSSLGDLWRASAQPAWENSVTWMSALDAWLLQRWPAADPPGASGSTRVEAAWQEFSEYRYFLGAREIGQHLQHGLVDMPGLELPLVDDVSLARLQAGDIVISLPRAMAELSTAIVRTADVAEGATLTANFDAAGSADRWSLSLIELDANGGVLRRAVGPVAAGSTAIDVTVGGDTRWLLVILAGLGDGTYNPNDDDWTGVNGTLTLSYTAPSGGGGGNPTPPRPRPQEDGGCGAQPGAPAAALLLLLLRRRRR